jgi:hypothetical protein
MKFGDDAHAACWAFHRDSLKGDTLAYDAPGTGPTISNVHRVSAAGEETMRETKESIECSGIDGPLRWIQFENHARYHAIYTSHGGCIGPTVGARYGLRESAMKRASRRDGVDAVGHGLRDGT